MVVVTEIREEIISNENGSTINTRGTGIGMGICTTTATDFIYFMDSTLHGASDGYYSISESNLQTSIVPLRGAAKVDLTSVKAQIDKEEEKKEKEKNEDVVVMKVEESNRKKYKKNQKWK